MNATGIISFYDDRRQRGEKLALATVIDTRGSTYSKAGAQMLIDAEGRFRGMLSGGCLEGDLAVRARVVLESGKAQVVTYDLGQDDEELWGLGVGCEGVMQVLLQPLDSNYEPYTSVVEVLRGNKTQTITITLKEPIEVDGNILTEVQVEVCPPPDLLVLGAGPDAAPVVRIAAELGWRCTVADHRPAYIADSNFDNAFACCCVPAEELSANLDLSTFNMSIVMSHHLVSDLAYLGQLAKTGISYIGLLGPASRRDRLLRELGKDAELLEGRLHGPAGLDIGGRGPASIALSIIAQMHAHLFGAD